MKTEKLMDISELAGFLSVPVATIYRWNHLGTGPTPIHIGRHVRYRPADVQIWVATQEVSRTPDLAKSRIGRSSTGQGLDGGSL